MTNMDGLERIGLVKSPSGDEAIKNALNKKERPINFTEPGLGSLTIETVRSGDKFINAQLDLEETARPRGSDGPIFTEEQVRQAINNTAEEGSATELDSPEEIWSDYFNEFYTLLMLDDEGLKAELVKRFTNQERAGRVIGKLEDYCREHRAELSDDDLVELRKVKGNRFIIIERIIDQLNLDYANKKSNVKRFRESLETIMAYK